MPELPEVETIKNAINLSVCGAKILSVSVHCRRFRAEIPTDFEQKITGATICDLKRIAKYILITLDNGLSLIWHLGMSGRIKICPSIPENLEKHDHVVIQTDKNCLVFNDARRFGLLLYCESKNVLSHPLLSQIGLDPFDAKLSANYIHQQFTNKKTAIKIALLDQSIINGIGNIYASEALFLAKINPHREAKSLSLKECQALIDATRSVLEKAIQAGGSTLKDYRKPDGSMGYFQNAHCVYNKTGQRCPDCTCLLEKTGGIQKAVLGGRSTFYCATLQK